jgi:hypothetical protein
MFNICPVKGLADTKDGTAGQNKISPWIIAPKSGSYHTLGTMWMTVAQQQKNGKTGYAAGDNGITRLKINGCEIGRYIPQVWARWRFPFMLGITKGERIQFDLDNVHADPVNNYCAFEGWLPTPGYAPFLPPQGGVILSSTMGVVERGYPPILYLINDDPNDYISLFWMEVLAASEIKPGRSWRQRRADGSYLYLPVTTDFPPLRKGISSGAAADGTSAAGPDPNPNEWAESSDDGDKTWKQWQYDLQYAAAA